MDRWTDASSSPLQPPVSPGSSSDFRYDASNDGFPASFPLPVYFGADAAPLLSFFDGSPGSPGFGDLGDNPLVNSMRVSGGDGHIVGPQQQQQQLQLQPQMQQQVQRLYPNFSSAISSASTGLRQSIFTSGSAAFSGSGDYEIQTQKALQESFQRQQFQSYKPSDDDDDDVDDDGAGGFSEGELEGQDVELKQEQEQEHEHEQKQGQGHGREQECVDLSLLADLADLTESLGNASISGGTFVERAEQQLLWKEQFELAQRCVAGDPSVDQTQIKGTWAQQLHVPAATVPKKKAEGYLCLICGRMSNEYTIRTGGTLAANAGDHVVNDHLVPMIEEAHKKLEQLDPSVLVDARQRGEFPNYDRLFDEKLLLEADYCLLKIRDIMICGTDSSTKSANGPGHWTAASAGKPKKFSKKSYDPKCFPYASVTAMCNPAKRQPNTVNYVMIHTMRKEPRERTPEDLAPWSFFPFLQGRAHLVCQLRPSQVLSALSDRLKESLKHKRRKLPDLDALLQIPLRCGQLQPDRRLAEVWGQFTALGNLYRQPLIANCINAGAKRKRNAFGAAATSSASASDSLDSIAAPASRSPSSLSPRTPVNGDDDVFAQTGGAIACLNTSGNTRPLKRANEVAENVAVMQTPDLGLALPHDRFFHHDELHENAYSLDVACGAVFTDDMLKQEILFYWASEIPKKGLYLDLIFRQNDVSLAREKCELVVDADDSPGDEFEQQKLRGSLFRATFDGKRSPAVYEIALHDSVSTFALGMVPVLPADVPVNDVALLRELPVLTKLPGRFANLLREQLWTGSQLPENILFVMISCPRPDCTGHHVRHLGAFGESYIDFCETCGFQYCVICELARMAKNMD